MSSILAFQAHPSTLAHHDQASYPPSCRHDVRQGPPSGGQEASRGHSSFANGLPTPPASQAMTGVTLQNNQSTGNISHHSHLARYPVPDGSSGGLAASRHAAHRPPHERSSLAEPVTGHRPSGNFDFFSEPAKNGGNVIASSFQIPESINSSKGSMAEFAAEVSCAATDDARTYSSE
jgi:hypothetical protein